MELFRQIAIPIILLFPPLKDLFCFFQFFDSTGFPCPPLQNPADHYLLCINSDFDQVQESLKRVLSHRKDNLDDEENIYMPVQSILDVVKTLTEAYTESDDKLAIVSQIEEMNKQVGRKT